MKTIVTFETANVDELKRVIMAIPSATELQAAILYPPTPLPDKASKAELKQAITDKLFWKAQAVKFARRIKALERSVKSLKRKVEK